jgi:hypothetical protein
MGRKTVSRSAGSVMVDLDRDDVEFSFDWRLRIKSRASEQQATENALSSHSTSLP